MPSTTSSRRSLVRLLTAAARRGALTAGGLVVASPASAHDELDLQRSRRRLDPRGAPRAADAHFQRRDRHDRGRLRSAGDGCRGHDSHVGRARCAGQRADAAARGRGIRSRHGAVEGGLERRAPDLGRVRVHGDRAGRSDPDADRVGDATPTPTPDETAAATPSADADADPEETAVVERRAAVDHRRRSSLAVAGGGRLPARLAGAPPSAMRRPCGPGTSRPRADRLEACLTTTSSFSAPAPAGTSRPSEALSSAFPSRSSKRSTGAVSA